MPGLLLAAAVAACSANTQRAAGPTAGAPVTVAAVPRTSVAPPSTPATEAATTTTGVPATTTTTVSTTTTTTTTTVPASAPAAPSAASACLARQPLRERAALLTWPGVYANQWDAAVGVVRDRHVGGVVLMTAGSDVAGDLAALRNASPHGLLVSTDEEGGAVQRLRASGRLSSAADVAATRTPDEARALVAAHGRVIRDLGIDVVLGPVVDVNPPGGTSPLGDRLFSDDPSRVAAYGRAYLLGWRDAGIVGVLKHFPGHGSASADTHNGPGRTPPLASLRARDLVPYAELAALRPAVMVGHLSVPGLTDGDGLPASLSRSAVTGLLRGELGYADALVFTDALEMGAVRNVAAVPEAAVLALAAGADVVLFSGTSLTGSVIDAIVAAVGAGRLSDAAITASANRVVRSYADPVSVCRAA